MILVLIKTSEPFIIWSILELEGYSSLYVIVLADVCHQPGKGSKSLRQNLDEDELNWYTMFEAWYSPCRHSNNLFKIPVI